MAEVIRLKREYKFGAKNFKEIVLDLEELAGQDLVFAEKEYKARNKSLRKSQQLFLTSRKPNHILQIFSPHLDSCSLTPLKSLH